MQEAVVQCLECMHDQPHLGFHNGRVEPIEDRWERMIAGTPWVASCTVTVDADDVETCSGPEAGDALSYAAFGDHGTREFFTHVRFHKHDEDRIVVHLLVELYARSAEEATEVLEEAARGHARDHLAGRGVAPSGVDGRRPALSRPRLARAPRSRQQLEHDQRQRHRHRRRQLVDDEEQQVEQAGDHQRQQRRRPLPRGPRRPAPRRAPRPRTGRRSPSRPSRTARSEAAAARRRVGGDQGRVRRLEQVGDHQPGCPPRPSPRSPPSASAAGVTAASSTPSVTQLSADSSAAAASPASGAGAPRRARTAAPRRRPPRAAPRARPPERGGGQQRHRHQRQIGQPGRRGRHVADRERPRRRSSRSGRAPTPGPDSRRSQGTRAAAAAPRRPRPGRPASRHRRG